jgi:16S rRNA (adenine1518-N6/adenine1519-N6)-dimethyltransferase
VRPRKGLSQHFLRDPRILARIASALDPTPDDAVLEIGAGEGTLTSALAPRVGRLVAIEKDRELAAGLRDRAARAWSGAVPHVVCGDALGLDWHELMGGPFKVAGNIPYRITSPLIEKALHPPRPLLIVFLVQSEVADRLAARPGTRAYGALSVGVQAVATVERMFGVAAGAFTPRPRVASAVVRLRPRAEPLVGVGEDLALRRFTTACFGQRRRQLRRALRTVWGVGAPEVERTLAELGLDPAQRPEALSVADFVSLLRAGGSL